MKHVYLVVEGPHDVEFVGRLLKPHGFKRVQHFSKLEPYWEKLVPTKFPHKGDLLRRVPVPTFLSSVDASVAVFAVGGDSKIVDNVGDTLQAILPSPPEAVGVLLDADSDSTPLERFTQIHQGLTRLQLGLVLPPQPGQVSSSTPRCGIFVLPDNQTQGTLEELLLEGAALHYPDLLAEAQKLVTWAGMSPTGLTPEDLEEFKKPAGARKAATACVAAILKPGKSIQVSVQDNRWIEGASLTLPRIKAATRFLEDLLGMP